MIATLTAVFDSNVLFGIRLTSLLMELSMSGLFRARWTSHIHREWMEAVSKECGIDIDRLAARRDAMDMAVPDGCVSGYEPLIDALILPDANDRHVLAAAIRCGASAIVTFNEKDFRSKQSAHMAFILAVPTTLSWTSMAPTPAR